MGFSIRRFAVICILVWAQAATAITLPADSLLHLNIAADVATVEIVGSERPDIEIVALPESVRVERDTVYVELSSESEHVLRINAPFDMDVTISVGRGNVSVERTYGDLAVRVIQGDITARGVTGAFNLATETGNIAASVFLNGESAFHADNGDIAVDVLDTTAFPVEVETDDGNVTVRLPFDYPASVVAIAAQGDIRSRLPIEIQMRPINGNDQLVGSLSGGGPKLRLTSTIGDIDLSPLGETPSPSQRAVYPAPLATQGILIDGMLEAAWLDAPVAKVGNDDGFEMQLMWDAKRLYVALVAHETDWTTLHHGATKRDDPLLDEDDAFDLLLRVNARTYRFTVNLLGAMLDAELIDGADDPSWNADATVETRVHPSAWVVELAIPHAQLGWDLDEGARFGWNAVRVRPNADDWDEWHPDGDAMLVPPRPPLEPRFPLTIEGNDFIPPTLLELAAGLPSVGTAHAADLPVLEARLRRLDWFQNVEASMTTPLDGESPHATLSLAGQNAIYVSRFEIVGAAAVPTSEWAAAYAKIPGWHSQAAIEQLWSLVLKGYSDRGYEQAVGDRWEAHPDENGALLVFRLNEGFMGGLIVRGNARIPTDAIERELRFNVGVPYNSFRADEALASLSATLSERYDSFESVSGDGVRMDDGVRRWVILIQERSPRRIDLLPEIGFNRVNAWRLGLGAHVHREKDTQTHVIVSGAFTQFGERRDDSSTRFDYRAGLLFYLTDAKTLSFGGHWDRQTKTLPFQSDDNPVNALSALIYGAAGLDYFSQEGGDLFLRAEFHPRLRLEAHTGIREEWSLARAVGSGWLRGPDLLTRGVTRPNRGITDGSTSYGRLALTLDARNALANDDRDPLRRKPIPTVAVTRGAWLNLSVESAVFDGLTVALGGKARGEWAYTLARGDVRAYGTLGKHAFSARVVGQATDEPLPRQQHLTLGGDLLRVSDPQSVSGELGASGTLEYRFQPMTAGPFIGAFLDTAKVWYHGRTASDAPIEIAAGVSVGIVNPVDWLPPSPVPSPADLLRVDVAYPVSSGSDADKSLSIWLRAGLLF